MATRARHQRLEMSGITALQSFTRVWDERMNEMAARENRGPWTLEQIRAMVVSISRYEDWLRTHFPEDFPRADHSSN
jgi:flagellar biosynthesis regulator FlaF